MGGVTDDLPPMTVEEALWTLAHARAEWRKRGNFKEADAIRLALALWGYDVTDLSKTEWRLTGKAKWQA